jgi:hypothetical protein
MTKSDTLQNRQVSLEDAFFLEQERKIIERQRARRQLEETRRDLSAASGICNAEVLDKLVSLNVSPETVASLALVPLVEVAWCDGNISETERKAVLDASHHAAANQATLDHELLAQWLTHRPAPELFTAWELYVKGLCELLSPTERQSLQKEILDHSRQVARANGGVLGVAPVSHAERAALARIEAAFNA